MPVYKDDGNGTFYVQCYYRDARGSKRHKTKRGFSSEVEAAVWESQFKSLNGGAMDMTFSEFVEVYASEVKPSTRGSPRSTSSTTSSCRSSGTCACAT